PAEGLANEFVGAVLEDRQGVVWVGTNRGLFRGDGRRFERLDEGLQLANIAFFALCERRDGRVVAGGPSGLLSMENGRRSPHGATEPGTRVYRRVEGLDGILWVGPNHGLRAGDTSHTPVTPRLKSMPGAMAGDRQGGMWFGTLGDGLLLDRA